MRKQSTQKNLLAVPIALLLSVGLAVPTFAPAVADETDFGNAAVSSGDEAGAVNLDDDSELVGDGEQNADTADPGQVADVVGDAQGQESNPLADRETTPSNAETGINEEPALEEAPQTEEGENVATGPISLTFVLEDKTKVDVQFETAEAKLGLNGAKPKNQFCLFGRCLTLSYFIGWSTNPEYTENLTGGFFYETATVQELLDAGVPSGSELYAVYAGPQHVNSVAKGTSVRINDALSAGDFVSAESDKAKFTKEDDLTTGTYKKDFGDYEIQRLDAVFKMNPFVASALYKDPWIGALDNGSDWSALSKKTGKVTVVDLHVKVDKRVDLPETFDLTFHSYVFRPYKVFSAVKPDGTPVGKGEEYPYIGVDQAGDEAGFGVLNRMEDNNPDTTFTVNPYLTNAEGEKVAVHDFVIRTRTRVGYDPHGKKIVPATMQQIQSDMMLSMQGGRIQS